MKLEDQFCQRYGGERYYTLNQYLRERFGQKVYKLALDGGMSCPNRDGTLGYGGCIFCSAGGSGEFAVKAAEIDSGISANGSEAVKASEIDSSISASGSEAVKAAKTNSGISANWRKEGTILTGSVTAQIEQAKARICQKTNAESFIAYFQSYTNTYAPVEYLRQIFMEAICHPQVAVLSIATRPDCLPPDVLQLLMELNQIKPVWVELGLQTIQERTARLIRRGYELSCYENAVAALRKAGIEVITHVILGLPGETKANMLETVAYLAENVQDSEPWGGQRTLPAFPSSASYRTQGIKLQLLHVLEGTDLAVSYRNGEFQSLAMEEYLDILFACLEILPPEMVVHRITGDGPKKILIAPAWSGNKKMVLNTIRREMKQREIWQGNQYRG